MPHRRRTTIAAVIALAALAGLGGGILTARTLHHERDQDPAATTAAAHTATPWTEPSRPPQPVAVAVISSPATGGDPSSTYCLAWTGSSSGTTRDAALLTNAPGYQCAADLVNATTGDAYDPYGVLYETPTDCTAPRTYPAILQGAWDPDTTYYVCLHNHTGA